MRDQVYIVTYMTGGRKVFAVQDSDGTPLSFAAAVQEICRIEEQTFGESAGQIRSIEYLGPLAKADKC